jgi:hypothetical protein
MALLALHISYLPHFKPAGGANETDDSLKLQRTAQHRCQEHAGWIFGCAFPHTHTHTNKNKIKNSL